MEATFIRVDRASLQRSPPHSSRYPLGVRQKTEKSPEKEVQRDAGKVVCALGWIPAEEEECLATS